MMKRLVFVLVIFMIGGFVNEADAQKKGRVVVCFQSDMDCANCETTLTEYLKFEKGVKDLKIDHASNTIFIEYKENKNSDEGFAKAIEKKGYKAQKISKEKYEGLVKGAKVHGHEHGQEVHQERVSN